MDRRNGNDGAFAMATVDGFTQYGLTKREHFAAMAMQGLCVQAIPGRHNTLVDMLNELPRKAVAMADALIEELSKEGSNMRIAQDIIDALEKEIASLKEQLMKRQEQHEKAMIHAGIEITKVQDKHDELLECLKREMACTDWYAEKYHWMRSSTSDVAREMLAEDLENIDRYAQYCGGKLARATQRMRE